jgi:cell division protein FtsL
MKTFKLENEPKIESGFIVPEQYFDDFSKKVLSQLPEENTKVIPLFQKRKTVFLAAAAVLVVGLLLSIYNQFTTNSDEIDITTLENHLTYQSNLNSYDLISELDDEDLTKLGTTIGLKDETIEEILVTNSDLEKLISE